MNRLKTTKNFAGNYTVEFEGVTYTVRTAGDVWALCKNGVEDPVGLFERKRQALAYIETGNKGLML